MPRLIYCFPITFLIDCIAQWGIRWLQGLKPGASAFLSQFPGWRRFSKTADTEVGLDCYWQASELGIFPPVRVASLLFVKPQPWQSSLAADPPRPRRLFEGVAFARFTNQ